MSTPDAVSIDLHVVFLLTPTTPSATRSQFCAAIHEAILKAYERQAIDLVIAQELWRAIPVEGRR